MGFEVSHLRKFGFASYQYVERPPITGQPTENYGQVSYAEYLNQSVGSNKKLAEPTEPTTPKRGRRRRSEDVGYPHTFPSVSVVRRFDRSRATAQWRSFESKLASRASKIGMEALRLSEIKVVLISEDSFQAAMEQSYAYASRLAKNGLRTKESRRVATDTGRHILDSSTQHHQTALRMLSRCNYGVLRHLKDSDSSSILGLTDREILDASHSMDRTPEEVVRNKADGLWQPYSTQVLGFIATGPRTFGLALDDRLGILRTEAEDIGQKLSGKNDHGFDMSHFQVGKNFQWKIDLVRPGPVDLSQMNEFRIPECPLDMPLLPPQVISDSYGN